MRALLLLLPLLLTGTGFAQELRISFRNLGLGSNMWEEMEEERRGCDDELILTINDTVMTYLVCERNGSYRVNPEYGDTLWNWQRNSYTVFVDRWVSDSITRIMDTLKGKYLFRTNPYVRSGGIDHLIVEGQGWCTHLELKNATFPAYRSVMRLLNTYLEAPHRSFVSDFWKDAESERYQTISTCPDKGSGSYGEALGREYDAIRNSKKME